LREELVIYLKNKIMFNQKIDSYGTFLS